MKTFKTYLRQKVEGYTRLQPFALIKLSRSSWFAKQSLTSNEIKENYLNDVVYKYASKGDL